MTLLPNTGGVLSGTLVALPFVVVVDHPAAVAGFPQPRGDERFCELFGGCHSVTRDMRDIGGGDETLVLHAARVPEAVPVQPLRLKAERQHLGAAWRGGVEAHPFPHARIPRYVGNQRPRATTRCDCTISARRNVPESTARFMSAPTALGCRGRPTIRQTSSLENGSPDAARSAMACDAARVQADGSASSASAIPSLRNSVAAMRSSR